MNSFCKRCRSHYDPMDLEKYDINLSLEDNIKFGLKHNCDEMWRDIKLVFKHSVFETSGFRDVTILDDSAILIDDIKDDLIGDILYQCWIYPRLIISKLFNKKNIGIRLKIAEFVGINWLDFYDSNRKFSGFLLCIYLLCQMI